MLAERTGPRVLLLVLTLLLVFPGGLYSQQTLPHADGSGEMTFALSGDAIITRRLSVFNEPEFLALRELIQGASAAFVNLEVLFHNFEPDVIPAAASGGTSTDMRAGVWKVSLVPSNGPTRIDAHAEASGPRRRLRRG